MYTILRGREVGSKEKRQTRRHNSQQPPLYPVKQQDCRVASGPSPGRVAVAGGRGRWPWPWQVAGRGRGRVAVAVAAWPWPGGRGRAVAVAGLAGN